MILISWYSEAKNNRNSFKNSKKNLTVGMLQDIYCQNICIEHAELKKVEILS
jgi:hypothetical protein